MPVSFLLFLFAVPLLISIIAEYMQEESFFAVPLLILVIPEYMREERLADLILNATNPVDMKHWGREIKAGEWPKMKAMALVNMEKVCCGVFVLHCVIVVVFSVQAEPFAEGSSLQDCRFYTGGMFSV